MIHFTTLGLQRPPACADRMGFLPELGDNPFDLDFDHAGERTHDENGEITEYGEWFEDEGFTDRLEDAAKIIAARR